MGATYLRTPAAAASGVAERRRRLGHEAAADGDRVPAGTPVIAGTVDAYAEAFSVGVRKPGDQMLMYGSTMFLVQIIDTYFSDPRCGPRRAWSAAAWRWPRAPRRRAA